MNTIQTGRAMIIRLLSLTIIISIPDRDMPITGDFMILIIIPGMPGIHGMETAGDSTFPSDSDGALDGVIIHGCVLAGAGVRQLDGDIIPGMVLHGMSECPGAGAAHGAGDTTHIVRAGATAAATGVILTTEMLL